MINFFSTWAQSIIIAIIIVVIIEMILPEGNNKKFIKMILGLYVLYIILNPLILKFSDGISFDNVIGDEYNVDQNFVEVFAINTNETIELVYIENIKREIKTYLSNKGFNVSNINVVIENENEESYGLIKELELTISQKDENSVINVETVQVNVREGEEKVKYITAVDNIKEYLENNYGIESDKIIINLE